MHNHLSKKHIINMITDNVWEFKTTNSVKSLRLIPFLLIDGIIVLILYLLLRLDWLANNVLYNYGLEFHSEWAIPYWFLLRTILGLLLFSFVAVTAVGVFFYKRDRAITKQSQTVFICKSCGNALVKLRGNININESVPKFKILKNCPLCYEKLIEK